MRGQRAPSATAVLGFAAAVLAIHLTAGAAHAQQGAPPGAPPPGSRDPFAEVRDRQQREARLRSIEMVGKAASAPVDGRAAGAAAEQVREDFKRIQLLRNGLARRLLSGKPLDYKSVADETGEINKRAGRLKTLLVRGAPEGDEKERKRQAEIDEALMAGALVTLCKRIDSFTENPVFNVPDVVDVKHSAKAGEDLENILLLSGLIRKGAERLNKVTKK